MTSQENNIYLNRLRKEYKAQYENVDSIVFYQAMCVFCLDTQLVSYEDIEVMENEINQSF